MPCIIFWNCPQPTKNSGRLCNEIHPRPNLLTSDKEEEFKLKTETWSILDYNMQQRYRATELRSYIVTQSQSYTVTHWHSYTVREVQSYRGLELQSNSVQLEAGA